MAKTLLAVDDSVTMRKVLEITFSGEDFNVVTTDTTQGALGHMASNPSVCVIDTSLGGEDGYALAKEVRKRNPGTSIIMLASRYVPYDQARGRDAGADDWADKPFDTQQLIDKVRKVVLAKEATGATVAPAAVAPPPPPTPVAAKPPAPIGVGRGTQPSLGGAVARAGTLMFGDNAPAPAPAAARPAPPPAPPPAPIAAPAPVAAAPAAASPVVAVSAAVNGDLAGKIGQLGLTPAQADAVLALSREVIERVVWEVVPQLAETLIKEEIARLTRD